MTRKKQHMLAYPFADTPISVENMREMLEDVEGRQDNGGATLETVLAHLISRALENRGIEAHGKNAAGRDNFIVGCGVVAQNMKHPMLTHWENFLLDFCDPLAGTEDIFEEVSAQGERALATCFIDTDGVVRYRP
jgi:hypothetical protein